MKNDGHRQDSSKSTKQVGTRRKKKSAGKRWFALILVVLILGALGWAATKYVKPDASVADQGGTFAARRGDLIVTVTEGGSIRAHKSIQYKCQVERRGAEVTILDIVPAGTYVTQEDVDNNMVLVKLDSSALEDQLIQEEMELSGDEQNSKAAKESYDIQVIQNESSIAQGKLEVRFALMDLQKYLGADLAAQLVRDVNEAASLPEHVAPLLARIKNDPNILEGSEAGRLLKERKDQIVSNSASLKTAEVTLAGTEKLYDANYVSMLELERDRLDVIRSRFSEENSNVDLDLFLSYDLPRSIEQYLSDYIESGRELERIYARCRSQLAQEDASLKNAQQRYQRQFERVEELKQQIDYCTIRAKAPGLVIYGSGDSGDAFRAMRGRGGGGGIIAEGEVVYEGQTIISMPDTAAMIAEISVHETEVDKVRAGQPAEIVMDAFPDRVLQGEVREVAPLPDQQRGFLNPDLKVYKTLVAIDGTHEFLKTRMSCKVQILVRELRDVVYVPIQVVANRGGRKVCYVSTDSGPKVREVRTGAFNDTFVQITEGLEEGEAVLMNPPLWTEGSTMDGEPTRERFGGRRALEEDEGQTTTPGDETGPQGGQPGDAPAGPGRRGGQRGGVSGNRGPMGMADREMTDEDIDRAIAMLKRIDPAKAKEYEELRKTDIEALKKKMREDMQKAMQRFQQGGGFPGAPGGGRPGQRGGTRPGRGGPGAGQGAGGGGQQSEGRNGQ